MFFFFQAEDGIRDKLVTGVQTCALPISNFVHEARSAAEVRHENLVPIFDAGEIDGRYYLAVGYVQGRTVDERIRADGPFPLGDVVRLATDVASALDALHAAGIVHRDVKAS